MKQNRHTQAIPADVMQQASDLISQANTLLAPYMLALTPKERHMLPKMGEKSLAFVEKAYEYAQQNSQLCPPYLDMQAFDIDYSDSRCLVSLQNSTRKLDEQVADTAMAAGSEAYQAALVFYNSVKIAAAQDVCGAKAAYEELRKRFPRSKRMSADDLPQE